MMVIVMMKMMMVIVMMKMMIILNLQAPVLSHTERFTVYIKNSVAFPYFGQQYRKNNIEGEQ